MNLPTVISEYRRYKRMAEKAMAQVSDKDLNRKSGEEENSIAIIVAHVAGNFRSRFTDFLTTDGEKPWRHRETEFEEKGLDREALLAVWEEGWKVLFNTLEDLSESDVEKRITIRQQPLTVGEALTRSVCHTAYHTGQIVQLARSFAGKKWTSLSIPRGQSASYNQNPTHER